MKLIIEQDLSRQEPEITIKCGVMDAKLKRLVAQLQHYVFSVPVRQDGIPLQIPLEAVFYFESVDNRTFLYGEKQVYNCDLRLYELEETLKNTAFVRISKNCIVNTAAVAAVRAQINGRLEATLQNGERLVVSKHYVRDFRDKFED